MFCSPGDSVTLRDTARAALPLLVLSTTSLHAQRGCFHSPEAPTGLLMLVGSVGMVGGSSLLRKLAARRSRNAVRNQN